MKMDRRTFFKGALALIAVSALPAASSADLPVLYLDGVNDDSDGLDALMNGRSVIIQGDAVRAETGHLEGATLLLSRPICMARGNMTIKNCVFRFTGQFLAMPPASNFDGVQIMLSPGATYHADPLFLVNENPGLCFVSV